MTKRINNTPQTTSTEKKITRPSMTSYQFNTIQLPRFEEKHGKPYVLYGGDNMYPEFVIQLYNRSAIHRKCINIKIDATIGKGLLLNSEDQSILEHANPDETWNEVFEKCTRDYVLFGGFVLNCLWDETGEYVEDLYHVPFSKVRSGILNDDEKVHQYWYSQNWKDLKKYKPLARTVYSKVTAAHAATEGKEENLSQILYFFDQNPDQSYYPLPEYVGCLNDVQIDISTGTFHTANLSNGMAPSMVINFPTGDPGPEAKFKMFEELSNNYASEQNAGRLLITYSDDKEKAPTVTPLVSTNDKYYIALEERITSRLLIAHGVPPILAGIREGGGLGNNAKEIETSWQYFQFQTIRPIQKHLLKVFNKVLDGFGFDDLKLEIIPSVIFNNEELLENKSETDTNVTTDGTTKSTESIKKGDN